MKQKHTQGEFKIFINFVTFMFILTIFILLYL